jgi:Skp family chaperone for outer membrane proteins
MRNLMRLRGPGGLALWGALLLTIASGTLSGCDRGGGSAGSTGSNVKNVGSLDQEVIFTLPEFKKAQQEMETFANTTEKGLPHPQRGKRMSAADEGKIREARLKIQQEMNKKLNPLKTRAEAAVASVARQKSLMVVLDKRIVVYGIPDITDDVKKAFEAPGDPKLGDEVDTSKSPIGYFDQEVVRALRAFQEADMDVYRKRNELMTKYQKKAANASPNERGMMEQSFKLEMENYQQQVMTPLTQKVNDAVKEVAAAEGVSLVLDKQHVMHGGRNMTNEVVEAFLKKVGGGVPGKPAGTSTPAPSVTP